VSEKEAAAARGDGRPPTITEQQRRQRVATATEHTATGELPDPTHEGATITDTPQTTGLDPGDGAKTGECLLNITDAPRTGTPASQTSRGGSTSRSRCTRRQLTQLLKEGSECFNPDEVRRIVQAARAGPEGSLTAICMLDDDVALFMHAFPDADDRELRAHCLSTLLENEESMQAWEAAKNSGELDFDSEDEDELTGIEQCPVFGCTREHAPNDCPTFLDMTPKERLDLVHAKQLCLLCLRHPSSVGCEVAGERSNCPAEGCDRPHHVTLHGVLRKVFPASKGHRPTRRADGRNSQRDSRDGKAAQRPTGGPRHRSWHLGGPDRDP